LSKCGLSDPHSITHELAQQVDLAEETVANHLASCVARAAQTEQQTLLQTVLAALEGPAFPGSALALAA